MLSPPSPLHNNKISSFGKFRISLHKLHLKFKAFKSLLNKEYTRLLIKENPTLPIKSLQNIGIDIADDVVWFGDDIQIDQTRPSLIHIGHHVFLHNGFKLRTHDYATYVFIHKYNEFIPSSGRVWIGDNVWFGENVTVLKGSTIGNDCIIGINSVVMGEIPEGSVAAGCPARVICTIDEYFERRKEKSLEESFAYARSIAERLGRRPKPNDFWEEFPLFVVGTEVEKYPDIPIKRQLGTSFDEWIKTHKPIYHSFDEFLTAAGL